MTKPKFETLYCGACGTKVGRKSGAGAVTGLVCDDPACEYFGYAGVSVERDSLITALIRQGVSAIRVAALTGFSRQRIYQIVTDYGRGQ